MSVVAVFGIFGSAPGLLRVAAEPSQDAEQVREDELDQIREGWLTALIDATKARRIAKTPTEIEQVQTALSTKERRFVERCLALAGAQPRSWIGLSALKLVAGCLPESEAGLKATAELVRQSASADLDVLKKALRYPGVVSERSLHVLAPIILRRVKDQPGHPDAAELLASIVSGLAINGDEGMKVPAPFAEAADLIVERYADSPVIVNFCELLGTGSGSPIWAGSFEKHLRTILAKNQDRAVRCAASFALASVVQGTDESRQIEAEKLYEEFLKKFDGNEDYPYANIEKMLDDFARQAVVELRLRGLGKSIPEIEGVDLDERGMKLSEYRGKVILLGFWATWCRPCMRMIPHERELAKRFAGQQFAIVGVNGDEDQQRATRAVAEHQMTWRSFRNQIGKGDRTISGEWNAIFPSFYLVDQQGIIRKRWIGEPPLEALNQAVDRLIREPAQSTTVK